MGIDTSLGYERGVISLDQYVDMPAVDVVVAGDQVLYAGHCHVRGDRLEATEKIACDWLHAGLAELAASQSLTDRGQSYLQALQQAQETGVFDPQY
jgi:hypothetical protein